MKPFMKYTGNHLFHYTKLESALKIIATQSLKFGDFENMNDIAEVKRDVYGMISTEVILKELAKYKSISLTLDNSSKRGFSIDPLWGHYAQNGNGVCLVFAKDKLLSDFRKQFGESTKVAPIKYLSDFSNAIFIGGKSLENVGKNIEENIEDIFFTKSIDWEYEHELRLLIQGNGTDEYLSYGNGTLIATILCLPKVEDYIQSIEFKLLKSLLPDTPILNYKTSLGNKELRNEEGEKMCGIIGYDWN